MDQFSHDPSFDTDDEAAARTGSRDSLLLSAQLRIVGESAIHLVRVRNLSPGGLMAEYAEPVSIGAAVDVEVRNIGWIKGRVAWATDGRLGIAFDREVDPLAARKPVGGGKKTPDFVKPILPRR